MPNMNEVMPAEAIPETMGKSSPRPLPVPISQVSKASVKLATITDADTSVQERRVRLVKAQKRYTTLQLFYAMFGILLMIVQVEYIWTTSTNKIYIPCPLDSSTGCPQCYSSLLEAYGETKDRGLAEHIPVKEGRNVMHAVRVLISFSTAILLYYVYAFYDAECEVLKIKNILPPKATLFGSSLRNPLLLEWSLLAVHPFVGVDTIDGTWPTALVATSLVMLIRVALLLRVVQFRHSFNTTNGWFIGSLTKVDFTATFLLKSTLKNHPIRCLVWSFLILVCVTGYSLFVVERYLCAFVADSCCQPLSLADALWSLFVTILTIGYGDVVPSTIPGRSFAVIAGLFGTLLTAVTIAVISNYLVLTRSEHKVNTFLKKDEYRRVVSNEAARTIQSFIQLRAAQHRSQNPDGNNSHHVRSVFYRISILFGASREKMAKACAASDVKNAEKKLYEVLRAYRRTKRYVNSHDVSDPFDRQLTMLEMMEVNVEYIRAKVQELTELFHSQMGRHRIRRRSMSRKIEPTGDLNSLSSSPTSQPIQPPLPKHDENNEYPTGVSEASRCVGNVQASNHGSFKRKLHSSHEVQLPSLPSPSGHAESVGIPEWATTMHDSMQMLMNHVSAVSGDIDHMKCRMNSRLNAIEERLDAMEQKTVVKTALATISRQNSTVMTRRKLSAAGSSRAIVQPDASNGARATAARIDAFPRSQTIRSFVNDKELQELATYEKEG